MGWAAIFQAIAQGITNTFATLSYLKENREQQKEIARQTQEQVNERAKRAKYAMSEQKTSFLKSGVYFDSGSPLEVINETYNTMQEDINAMNSDSRQRQNQLRRAGRTAFFSYLIDPVGNNGSQYASNIYQGFQNSNSNKTSGNFNINNTKTSGYPASSKMTGTKIA